MAERLVYTIPEAAHALGISVRKLHDQLHNGTVPAKRIGNRWVIGKQALADWLAGNDEQAPPKLRRVR